jgi:hypothetical protein
MTVATEARRTRSLLDRLNRVEQVAQTLPDNDPRRAVLLSTVEQALADADPVRPVVAADLLHFTEKTVREWAREGVLRVHQERPRLLLDAARLHEIARLVHDLRQAGRSRGLLDEVHRRLADWALLDREDLTESLEQMRLGQGRVVRPKIGI